MEGGWLLLLLLLVLLDCGVRWLGQVEVMGLDGPTVHPRREQG